MTRQIAPDARPSQEPVTLRPHTLTSFGCKRERVAFTIRDR